MNFDSRMKKVYEESYRRQAIVAKHNRIPIGYIFSTIDKIEGQRNNTIHLFASVSEGETVLGFFPEWLNPQKIGMVNNLYFRQDRDLEQSYCIHISLDILFKFS